MRKMNTTDIPALSRTLKKLGLKDQFRELALKSDGMADVWSNGFDLIWNLFDRATETEGERVLYEFLSGPFEMTPEQVADLDLETLFDMLGRLVEENNLGRFFDIAARLMR